jgi:lysozyme
MNRPSGRAIGAAGAVGGASLFTAAILAMATPEIQRWEGRRLYPYFDIVGKLTTCDGETHGVEMRPYTTAECDAMTARRLKIVAEEIRPCLPPSLPAQIQVSTLLTAYNTGAPAFCGSSISRKMRAGDLAGGCRAILAWNKGRIGGKLVVIRGLDLRRKAESALCMKGVA